METETAFLISLARVDHHVLTFQGGPHQAITGWHSMFANDVTLVMRMMNWCKSNSDEQTMSNRGDQSSDDDEQSKDTS
jgi:hypothetical protein